MRLPLILMLGLLAGLVRSDEVRWLVNMSSLPVSGVIGMQAAEAALPADGVWDGTGVRVEAFDGELRWQVELAPLSTRRVALKEAPQPVIPLNVKRDDTIYQVSGWTFGPGGPAGFKLAGAEEIPTVLEQAGQLYARLTTGEAVTWLVLADGALRIECHQPASAFTLPAEAHLTPEPLGAYSLTLGGQRYVLMASEVELDGGQLILGEGRHDLMPLMEADDVVGVALRHDSILAFRRDEAGTFSASDGTRTFRVIDANKNDEPDLVADQWIVTSPGFDTAGWRFLPAKTDPPQTGAAWHIAYDTNEDGNLDQREWSRPVWRFVDQNGDGAWLRGSLLRAGLLEQDALYYRASGSPAGTLWDRCLQALDLDGDGDQDVIADHHGYNFNGKGQVDLGFDFTDTGRAPRVLLDGPPRIDMAARPAGTARGVAVRPEAEGAPWLLSEERLAYGDGRTLSSRDGTLIELSMGNGLKLEPALELGAWQPATITYRDPWGHSLTVVSALLPTRWDGQALSLQDYRDGRLDLSDQAPWPKAVESPHQASLVFPPDQRREEVPHGQTPKAVYFSPLFGGLHTVGVRAGATPGGIAYYDEDEDGVIDHYVWPEITPSGIRVRAWRYDRTTNNLRFRDGNRAVSLTKVFDFPRATLYLGDQQERLKLLEQAAGAPRLISHYALNDRGQLPGTRSRPVRWPVKRVLADAWHANGRLSTADGPTGLRDLLPLFARHDGDLGDLSLPLNAERLREADILVITHMARSADETELQHLRRWIAAGGILLIGPAAVTADQRLALNVVLDGLGIAGRFGEQELAATAGPQPATTFSTTDPALLRHCGELQVSGWPVDGAQVDLLRQAGQTLIGLRLLGKGSVIMTGLPLLSNAGGSPADNRQLTDNLLRVVIP